MRRRIAAGSRVCWLAAGQVEEAEVLLRAAMAQAELAADFGVASAAAGDLADLLRRVGKPHEALQVLDRRENVTRPAGHGPWSLLVDEVQRLSVLLELGETKEVLRRTQQLRDEVRGLPDRPGPEDRFVNVWKVRDAVLNTGFVAALALAAWQQALDFNAESLRSIQYRGAGVPEQARLQFNDYGPLLRLGRHAEVRALLGHCRETFEAGNDIGMLGKVFSALADLENLTGHHENSVRFERTALRFRYVGIEPDECAISHFNLANYLTRTGSVHGTIVDHRLAAVLIRLATRTGRSPQSLAALASDLPNAGVQAASALPADFAALCATVEEVEGVRFRELMERLTRGGPTDPDALLREAIGAATQVTAATNQDAASAPSSETSAPPVSPPTA